VNVHGGISYPDCDRKVVGFFYSGYNEKLSVEKKLISYFIIYLLVLFSPNSYENRQDVDPNPIH
jgi:hypothetical protein